MKHAPATATQLRLGWRTVLGLDEPDLPNWSKVRAAQLRDLRRMLPVMWATNVCSTRSRSTYILWGTIRALAGADCGCAAPVRGRRLGRSAPLVRADPGAIRRPAGLSPAGPARRRCAAIGLGDPADPVRAGDGSTIQVAICLVLGAMLASAPVTLSAVPLAMTLLRCCR